ncbi:MAG: aldehyde dehydrogenase family protein, partial [Deltaproteobacteria bacterium]|nr:aldehyde dehydrogenase family protein [Deltaproteobacteria bacterium]
MTTSKITPHFIGGKNLIQRGERRGEVFNPATGEVQGHVGFATVDEVDAAVASAKKASEEWRNSSLANRTRILFSFRELVNKHKDDIAKLLTLEHGKVFSDAQG